MGLCAWEGRIHGGLWPVIGCKKILSIDTKRGHPLRREPIFSCCCRGWGSDTKRVFPGSWAQDPEVFRTWEGKTVSVTCWHNPGYRFNEKFWCKETSEVACQPLVSSVSRGAEKLRLSIQEDSRFSFFTVTMTELETADSGIYHCGFFGNQRNFIYILRTIHLVVSKGELPLSMSFLSLPE